MDSITTASDNIWWDEENKKVHKNHELKSDEELREYALEMGKSIKNGVINV